MGGVIRATHTGDSRDAVLVFVRRESIDTGEYGNN